MQHIVRRIAVPIATTLAVAGGTLVTAAPSAEAATTPHGVWNTLKGCKNAQWRSMQKHPSWYHSGCYWDNTLGMVGYWYTTRS